MSQVSATPVSSQFHEQPSIHGCRWAWCRLIFPTNAELAHHVIHEHVQKAVPVMRKDLPMLRRVEEGLGESLSLSGLGLSYPQDSQESSTGKTKQIMPTGRDTAEEIQPSSSLPSPPASSPIPFLPLPPVQDQDNVPPAPDLPEPDSDSDTSSESEASEFEQPSPTPARHSTVPNSSRHPTPLVRHDPPVTPHPRQARFEKATPSFAALSSPADSPSIPPIPPTPSFNSQVESATGKRKRNNETPSRAPPRMKPRLLDSVGSNSSFGSQDSVEKHLTQSLEVCEDNYDTHLGDRSNAGGSQHKPLQTETETRLQLPAPSHLQPPHVASSLGGINNPPAPVAAPALKQAWYGIRPPVASTVKHKKNASAAGFRVLPGAVPSQLSNSHPKTSTSGQPNRPHPTSLNIYRSGILEISPPAVEVTRGTTHGDMPEDFDAQSQSQTQESSLEYLSYPLQTQAPYESQSLSQ